MRLKLCELGCSVSDEKTMERYAGPALQVQVEGGRGSKKLWCACYLNPKNFPENLVFVVAGLPKLYFMTCVKVFGDVKECFRGDTVLTTARDVNAKGRKRWHWQNMQL